MKNVLNIGLRLTLIAVLAAAALGYTNYITKGPIAEQKRITKEQTMAQVLPEADSYELICSEEEGTVPEQWQGQIVEASAGYSGDALIGYAVTASQKGFGGPVNVMVGIGGDGSFTGASLLSHNETPGLGAEAAKPFFIDQYTGKTAPLTVVKSAGAGDTEIQAITGATITSRSVTEAVNHAAAFVDTLAEGSDGQ